MGLMPCVVEPVVHRRRRHAGISWQGIFWINLPVGAVAIASTSRRITESTGPNNRFALPDVRPIPLIDPIPPRLRCRGSTSGASPS